VITAREIAEQFGISQRTVYRDIRVLEESGIPVAGEAGQGYTLVDGFKLPPLMFTTEEAIAFLMAEKLINRHTDENTYSIYRSGMDKIRAVLRAAEKNFVEDFHEYIYMMDKHQSPPSESEYVITPLLRCIISRCDASIEYFANYSREITIREIEPLGLFFMMNQWYLLAWCRLRKDYRTFNVSRIRNIIPEKKGFIQKHEDLKTIIKKHYLEDFIFDVAVEVEREGIRYQGSTKYFFGLYKEEERNGNFIQYYSTHSLEEFARWYISFAEHARILKPLELKDIIQNMISKIKL